MYLRYSLLLLMLVFSQSCAIKESAEPEPAILERIFEYPNKSKTELYVSANSWFVEYFNSAESVIEYQDKEAGKLMGNYTFRYSTGLSTIQVKQTIDVSIKDKKVKLIIKNPYHKLVSNDSRYGNSSYTPYKPNSSGLIRVKKQWEKLALSFDDYLKNATNDW